MRIGICDDDIQDIEAAEHIIRACESKLGSVSICRFQNEDDIVESILAQELDVLLLDIDMPGRDGIEIGDALARNAEHLNLIFFTNRDDMVFRAIHCQPYRFIRKSHMEEELQEALVSVRKKMAYEQLVVCFERKEERVKLPIRDILYLESNLHYLSVHEWRAVYRVRGTMSKYERQLQEAGFIRIHHSYLVNIRFIRKITPNEVVLDTGETLAVSRAYSRQARDEYNRGVKRFINGIHI